MFTPRCLVSVLLILMLTSCGGGSDSSSSSSSSGSSGSSGSSYNESANGYWNGLITDSEGTSSEVVFFSSEGKFIAADAEGDVVVSGSLNINEDKLTSTNTKLYEYDGIYLMDLEVDGFVTTKSRILADVIDVESGEKSSLSLDYDIFLNEPITYSDLFGSWNFLDANDELYSVNIDDRGAFYADVDGCIITGKFSIPNNTLSIISTEFTVSGESTCIKGTYNGLGALYKDELVAVATNNQYAIVRMAFKSSQ
jgi:hypothetical protein